MKYLLVAVIISSGFSNLLAQTANPNSYQYIFTVAKDGSGEFATIQDAINAMRVYPLAPITLYIKNGVYREKIELPATNTDVRFIGESVEGTIISFDDYSGKEYAKGKHNTFSSFTAKISGNRFVAQNITFENTAGRVGQALALYVDADQAVFLNCRFIGNQDTIFTGGEYARQYFIHCYIEGTTDFIFGPATAFFDSCTIKAKTNSFITAASTTSGKRFGYVFRHCKVIADTSVTKFFFGRPWWAYAKTVFIRCELPAQLAAEGWDNWGNPANEKTVYYGEHQNTGPGAAVASRVAWSKQLSQQEALLYSIDKVLATFEQGSSEWFKQVSLMPFCWQVAVPKQ